MASSPGPSLMDSSTNSLPFFTPLRMTEDSRFVSPTPATPSPLESSSTSTRRTVSAPLSATANSLFPPTRAVFEAQAVHSAAIAAELDLYRSLALRLQQEVAERDAALTELNLRAVEAEMRQSESSSKPSAEQQVDRTTVVEAEVRDMEIRLAKADSEREDAVSALTASEQDRERITAELAQMTWSLRTVEDRERDLVVSFERREAELRADLEHVNVAVREGDGSLILKDLDEARSDLEAVKSELSLTRSQLEDERLRADDFAAMFQDEKQRSDSLEEQMTELESRLAAVEEQRDEWRAKVDSFTEEAVRLTDMANDLQALERERDEWHARAEDLEREVEQETEKREKVERELVRERSEYEQLHMELDEIKESLRTTRAELALASAPQPTQQDHRLAEEVSRLRQESASKDLQIAALERRKSDLKEDREMLNIALDSKQQELELMKRKFAVRGVAGSTPLAPSSRNFNTTTPMTDMATPAPSKGRVGPGSSLRTRRSLSAAYMTPAPFGSGRVLRGGDVGAGVVSASVGSRRIDHVTEEEAVVTDGGSWGPGLKSGSQNRMAAPA